MRDILYIVIAQDPVNGLWTAELRTSAPDAKCATWRVLGKWKSKPFAAKKISEWLNGERDRRGLAALTAVLVWDGVGSEIELEA